jgi:predicted 2-oxoglutarate/Fe(II)-dependent dioxygenase YbiX
MNYIHTFDDVFTPTELELFQRSGRKLVEGKAKNGSFYREGMTSVFDKDQHKQEYDALFSAYNILLTTKLFSLFDVCTLYGVKHTGFEFHTYEPGDVCQLHSDGEIASEAIADSSNKVLTDIRFASAVLCLSDIVVGGELVFPKQEVTIKAKKGRVVVFPPYSLFPHFTTPTTERRDVIVTWFAYENALAVNPNMFAGAYGLPDQ